MLTKIYVAASSAELERAVMWSKRLRDSGFEVVSTWTTVVQDVGDANPRAAPTEQRLEWSTTDLAQVAACDLFWLLAPPKEAPTRGAWLELGFARAVRRERREDIMLVSSGDTKQSIFCALTVEFSDDIDAFTYIVRQARESTLEVRRERSTVQERA